MAKENRTQVLGMRLRPETLAEVESKAEEIGLSASSYARMLVLRGMQQDDRPALEILRLLTSIEEDPALLMRLRRLVLGANLDPRK